MLFILSDDQRADTIGAWGNPHVVTPNLDRLAARGLSFTRAYIMGAFQGAVCTPSRAMLMTSLSLPRVRDDLEGQATWPEQFGRAGYRTFLTGKWHNGTASALRAFERGRSVFYGGMANPYGLAVQDFSRGEADPPKRTLEKHDSEEFADAAVAFLRARGTARRSSATSRSWRRTTRASRRRPGTSASGRARRPRQPTCSRSTRSTTAS